MARTITIRHQIGFHADFPESDLSKRPSSIGILQPGAIVPIVGEKEGFEFEKELNFLNDTGDIKKFKVKSNIWYQDMNGWWYWNGATRTLEEAESDTDSTRDPIPGPTPVPIPVDPVTDPVTHTFDWRKKARAGQLIPEEWMQQKGEGLNIAIIDAGFDLMSPCFKHLEQRLKTYDPRKEQYNNLNDLRNEQFVKNLAGLDKMPVKSHGTSCLSIMGANDPNKEILGLVPNANFFLFNVYEHQVGPFGSPIIKPSRELMDKAILMISHLEMDIVSVSVDYPDLSIQQDELISQTMSTNTLWFWALKSSANPSLDKYILDANTPTPFFPLNKVGVLLEDRLSQPDTIIVSDIAKEKINFIVQESEITVVEKMDKISHHTLMTCSFATPYMASLAALKLGHEKSKNPAYLVDSKTFISELKNEATRFYKDYIPVEDTYTFLHLNKNPLT